MMPPQLLDPEEFHKLQLGDKKIYKKVYNEHFSLIHYVVTRCGVTKEDSLDIVQETFIKLHHKSIQLQSASSIKSWLIVAARNLALDHIRKQKIHQQYLNTHGQDDKIYSSSDGISEQQLHELELALVGRLIEEIELETNDDTFSLYYREGLTAKVIAERHGEALSTVTNRISRLRNRFREKFQSHIKKLHDAVL